MIPKEKALKKGESLVINYKNLQTGTGAEHWVCVYKGSGETSFFDSFGSEPSPIIRKWLKKTQIRYNTVDIQSFDSVACGWYCIHVLTQLAGGRDLEDVCDDFARFNTWDMDAVRKNDDRLVDALGKK